MGSTVETRVRLTPVPASGPQSDAPMVLTCEEPFVINDKRTHRLTLRVGAIADRLT